MNDNLVPKIMELYRSGLNLVTIAKATDTTRIYVYKVIENELRKEDIRNATKSN